MPSGIRELDTKLQWLTRGENCHMCNALRGRVYSYDMWMSVGIWPGFHIGCNCYLKTVAIDSETSDPDFFGADVQLQANSWYSNLPGWFGMLQWNFNFEPFPHASIKEIEEAHLRYGPDVSIGDALRMLHKENNEGFFFKRPGIFNEFMGWRMLRTMQFYECIDGTFCGAEPPGKIGLHFPNDLYKKWSKKDYWASKSKKRYLRYRSGVNGRLAADELKPEYPYQSYHYGSR